MPSIVDPDLEGIRDALSFLVARAGRGVLTELPHDPFAALERLRARVVPVVPKGWALAIHEYGSAACDFAEKPGYFVLLLHPAIGNSPEIWEAEGEAVTISAAVAAAIENIAATGCPDRPV